MLANSLALAFTLAFAVPFTTYLWRLRAPRAVLDHKIWTWHDPVFKTTLVPFSARTLLKGVADSGVRRLQTRWCPRGPRVGSKRS